MKKLSLTVLIMFMLCGCSSADKQMENFESWRQGVDEVSFTAVVTVSNGDMAAEYELECSCAPEETKVEIISPEKLKGITASVSEDENRLEFDGLVLDLGELDGVSPIGALPAMVEAIRNGYVESCYNEKIDGKPLTVFQFSPVGELVLHLWLDEYYVPQRAHFECGTSDGISIEIKNWNIG